MIRDRVKRELANRLTLAILLTLSRICLIPFVILAIILRAWNAALCLFVIAAITDILDGACARLFDEQTITGALLDPIADKLLILSCYGALACSNLPAYIAPSWLVFVIFLKEIALMVGAIWLAKTQSSYAVRPSLLGKAAMLAQTISVFWLLLILFTGNISPTTLLFLHQCVLFLILASFVHYVYKALKGTRLWYSLKKSLYSYF